MDRCRGLGDICACALRSRSCWGAPTRGRGARQAEEDGPVRGEVPCPEGGITLWWLPRGPLWLSDGLCPLGMGHTNTCAWVSDPEDADEKFRGLSGQLVDTACKVCQAYLGQLEHEDIDVSESSKEELSEDEWNDLIQQYYSLVHGDAFISSSRSYFSQCQALLNKITSVNPQTEIDGLRNIWIIKPAAKSRGRDIVCMDRVEDILELAAEELPSKDNKWVVQKYIETPMLIYDTKFDIRQWFLVTDWNPLTIWFYKESYLRFSTQRFSLDNLDSAIHLCNHSIQKRLRNDQGRSPLLPGHNMWSSSRFQEYLQKRGRGAMWGSVIYPSMKRAITNAMKVAQDHVEARKNSFELYGADFILGRDFKPWLIEINSSPTMHPSTPVTAQLCAQVQEDTIKVVVDRKVDRNCDIGNFELLWRQPVVELPPFNGSDLCVEGIGMKKAKRQMPPITNFNFPASLCDAQLLKVRCPSAVPGLAGGAPRGAGQDWKREDAKALCSPLPAPPQRPAERSCRAKLQSEAGARRGGREARAARLRLPARGHSLSVRPLAPAPQSAKSVQTSLSPRPPAAAGEMRAQDCVPGHLCLFGDCSGCVLKGWDWGISMSLGAGLGATGTQHGVSGGDSAGSSNSSVPRPGPRWAVPCLSGCSADGFVPECLNRARQGKCHWTHSFPKRRNHQALAWVP
ncbi:Hypothetical predicted protein [Marmota monax]|uniref:ATP-grasp domain-containing protein n=1 Tax=Marmota monax TaxID=9995 RepID=A0A5E4CJV0_MARMO|nr:Hypothetical predicted protein [Marmota monax]